MEMTTISSKFQLVIPRKIREQFHLKPGQKVVFIPYRKTLRMVIVPSMEEVYGMLEGLDIKNLREETDEERS